MNHLELTTETWSSLKAPDHESGGYPSIMLSINEGEKGFLHLFKDINGYYHFAIQDSDLRPKEIDDPSVNGLQVKVVDYRFQGGSTTRFIDLTCSIAGYIEEFTEIVKEISKAILVDKEKPVNAVNQIINNWISFWSNQRKELLSEEGQIGLICELLFFEKLCTLNSNKALSSWTGPHGEKHDFNFTDWNFEVKGTRRRLRKHTVNGIDQLNPTKDKGLGFVSVQLITSNNERSINLPTLIERIIINHFLNSPQLHLRFNDLLAKTGYSPVHEEEYRKFNIEVLNSTLFKVDESFPRLTTNMLKEPLNIHVSSVTYDISLENHAGIDLMKISLSDYFY